MKQRVIVSRATLLGWLSSPGLTNREIANRSGHVITHVTQRMQLLEAQGYVERKLERSPVGRPRIRWTVRADHPPIDPKPALKPPAEKTLANRRRTDMSKMVVVRGDAPDRDPTVVGQAVEALPDLHSAWMGRPQT